MSALVDVYASYYNRRGRGGPYQLVRSGVPLDDAAALVAELRADSDGVSWAYCTEPVAASPSLAAPGLPATTKETT